jgi:murein DD-endopeptidase MepM/ murein hydrolase activator NlpD
MNLNLWAKKIPALFLGILLGTASFLFSFSRDSFQSPSGIALELDYRALEPGEVVLVIQKEKPGVTGMTVHFLDKTFSAVRGGDGAGLFALVGLDVEVKPGSYPFNIELDKANGEKEDLQREILILPKKFQQRKFRVKAESLNPPPQLQARIKRESELMQAIYKQITPEWLAEGEFIIPFEAKAWPNFGQRRIYNNVPLSIHSGVDLLAPWGSPIRASNSGRIVLARDLVLPGRSVIIDHGMGLYTFYCHLSRINVKEGAMVKKGDIVAKSGNTGRSTGPHLHWAVKLQETRVDPFSLLGLPLI